MTTPGSPAAPSQKRCFPEKLQAPALGSADLQALRDNLAKRIADAKSQAAQDKPVQPVSASLTVTANRAPTYASSGSARVDVFFKCKGGELSDVPDHEGQIDDLLQQAWQEDATDTLKLMAHLRDVRGGKGEQKLFHECVAWLKKRHPLTLITNLPEIVKVGYWKDLLEIVVRACVSPEHMKQRAEHSLQNKIAEADRKHQATTKQDKNKSSKDAAWRKIPELKEMRKKSFRKHLRKLATPEEREQAKTERAKQTAHKQQLIADFVAKQKQQKRKFGNAENVIKQISENNVFQLLHLSVAVLFAEQLQKDLEALKQDKKSDVSLAAKWAPTPARSHDKDTLMASRIAEFLFPANQHQSQGEAYSAYAARITGLYHKQVLVPLRRCLDVPEVYMSANAWQEVKYPRVPSVCMKNNKAHFEKHDEERFKEYLGEVKAGKKKIASGALKPHELVGEAMMHNGLAEMLDFMDADEMAHHEQTSSAVGIETMELQWKSYVSNLKASGVLSNALAVCDVSGSMSGQPMQIAIALSLLVAEVTAAPFDETVCTFSSKPQLHRVKGTTLVSRVNDLQRLDWGMNTNINAVFQLILQRAIASNIPAEQMIETLFIFSDMQFDEAAGNSADNYDISDEDEEVPDVNEPTQDKTNFAVVKAAFEEHGYNLPKIVFWNLKDDGDDSMPVTHTEGGTALVSGFSGQLLKLFMAGASELDKFNPFAVMKEAISAECYKNWKVAD